VSGAAVSGAWSFNPASGTTAGSYAVTGTFTSSDSNYQSGTATGNLVIDKATPTITWATPQAINFGTALNSTQLDAVASAPGTFVYTPASGVIPPAGNDTLSVVFTPTDSTDYNNAHASVTLTVNASSSAPAIASISPGFTTAGGNAFTLTVNGTGFVQGATIYWGTSALATTDVSSTQLTAQVTAAQIANAGVYNVTVQSPGGSASNILQFEVDSAGAGTTTAPAFSSASVTVAAGSTATDAVTLPSGVISASVTCLNLPTGATCTYSSGTLSIATSSSTPKGTYQIVAVFTETFSGAASSFLAAPFLLLPLLFLRRKRTGAALWLVLCMAIAVLGGVAAVTGCGGSSSGSQSVNPPPTHTLSSSGSVNITVQ
jgi:hypothetical protein